MLRFWLEKLHALSPPVYDFCLFDPAGWLCQRKTDHRSASLQAHCQALEAKAQGRLGVSIVDTATGQQWGWREDERFMMLSSFKLLASALVLHRVDQGRSRCSGVWPTRAVR